MSLATVSMQNKSP